MRKLVLACAAMAAVAYVPVSPATADTGAGDAAALGRCIVKADRSVAASLLESLPIESGAADLALVRGSGAAGCLAANPSANTIALRGAIANELFIKDFGEFGMRPKRAITDLVSYELPVGDSAQGVDPSLHARYRLADCAVRNDTPRIERLLRTQMGSSTEMNILSALGPVLNACQPAGEQIALGRGQLRSMLALAAYNVSARYWTGSLNGVGIQ